MSEPTKDIKLVCGHRVPRNVAKVEKHGDTGWCPTCKLELFTGWPEYMEENAKLAVRVKASLVKFLDGCERAGKRPSMTELVGACESILRAHEFDRGYSNGGAIDADD